jgi:hypothetical protein
LAFGMNETHVAVAKHLVDCRLALSLQTPGDKFYVKSLHEKAGLSWAEWSSKSIRKTVAPHMAIFGVPVHGSISRPRVVG